MSEPFFSDDVQASLRSQTRKFQSGEINEPGFVQMFALAARHFCADAVKSTLARMDQFMT